MHFPFRFGQKYFNTEGSTPPPLFPVPFAKDIASFSAPNGTVDSTCSVVKPAFKASGNSVSHLPSDAFFQMCFPSPLESNGEK